LYILALFGALLAKRARQPPIWRKGTAGSAQRLYRQGQWRTQKIFMGGGFIQWHMVVICIWCALFVTSQFHVIFMFPKQSFGEVY